MIFYYIKNSDIHIADFNTKKNLVIDNNDDLDIFIKRNNKEIWITYDQAEYLKDVVTVYDCKDEYSIKYKMNSYNVKTELEAVVETFFENIDTYKCKMALINEFKLPKYLINSSIASITAYAIGGTPCHKDEFDFIKLDILNKYSHVKKFFDNNKNYSQKYKTMIAGVEHTYGYGGCHGARKSYCSSKPVLVIDIKAFYPTMLNKLGYFNIKKISRVKYIHEQNLRLRGKPERLPYKLADNSIVGNFKNKFSDLYNPRASNVICVNGQLLITLLIEMLEPYIKLVQTNTDGIIIEYDDFDTIDRICEKFEDLTGYNLTFTCYDKIYQKDVNNYLLVGDEIRAVGELRECSEGKYTESIIKRSMRAYLTSGEKIAKTINNCKDEREFQILAKPDYRVFANIYGRPIKGVFSFDVSNQFKYYDENWYISEAIRRVKKYGVTL